MSGFDDGGGSPQLAFTGGLEDLQAYATSVYSASKEKLIRALAKEIFAVLKMKGNVDSAPISKIVEALRDLAPVKGKNKFNKAFNSSSEKQKELCRAIGQAINNHYRSNMIDMSASENAICDSVAEVLSTLTSGLNSEFMSVSGDVSRILNNIQTLQDLIDRSYNKQRELIAAANDPQISMNAKSVAAFYERLKTELKRQTAMLSNLTDSAISPTTKTITALLEDNRDFVGFVHDLKADLGTNAFGDKLGYLLSGVSTVAHSAELIDKALKRLGMSIEDFKSAKDLSELRSKMFNHVMEKEPNSDELDTMMALIEIIIKNDYSHQDIVKHLMSKKGGCGCTGGEQPNYGGDEQPNYGGDEQPNYGGYDSDADDGVMGGNPDFEPDGNSADSGVMGGNDNEPPYWARKSIKKKLDKKDKYRKLLLIEFRKVLKQHFRNIVVAANSITDRIGKEIPIDKDLRQFIIGFKNLPKFNRANLEYILSGYPKDSVSKQERDDFLDKYKLLLTLMNPLMKGSASQYFKPVYSHVSEMIHAIDDFSDKLVKAITEIHIDRPEDIRTLLKKSAAHFFDLGVKGGAHAIPTTGDFVALDAVANNMDYQVQIADIMGNLKNISRDTELFSKEYEEMLGEEAGWIINSIKAKLQSDLADADESKESVANSAAQRILQQAAMQFCAAAVAGTPARQAYDAAVAAAAAVAANAAPQSTAARTAANAEVSACVVAANADATFTKHKKDLADNYKAMLKRQADAKVKMVEVAQAVDLYMRAFTDGMAKNPDSIKNISDVLDSMVYNIRWFTDRAGDNLATLFETAPVAVDAFGVQTGYSNNVIDAAGNVTLAVANNANVSHYYHAVAAVAGGPNAGNPLLARPLDSNQKVFKARFELTEKAVKSVRALENIMLAFQSIGSKFNGVDLQSKTFMTIKQMIDALQEYCVASAYATDAADYKDNADKLGQNLPCGKASAVLGMGFAGVYDDSNYFIYHQYSNANNANVPDDAHGWKNSFATTDMLFTMSVKSIVCKVFTVIDAYRLFNRPVSAKKTNLFNPANPLRTILGAGSTPNVIPEALELYLRLPLLAEWYRKMFSIQQGGVGGAGAGNDWLLYILPMADGVWSDFLNAIFEKADYVTEGNYSEQQLQGLIRAINAIYTSYKAKYPTATPRNIMNAFVLEINRLYGFMKREEINAYLESKRSNLNARQAQGDADDDDFGLLGDDSGARFGRNIAPSDKYVVPNMLDQPATRSERVMIHMQEEIVKLRKQIDVDMYKAQDYPFKQILENYVVEIQNAKDNNSRYALVLKMIQSISVDTGKNKIVDVMLHETVCVPLTVLYNVYKLVSNYNTLLHANRVVLAPAAAGVAAAGVAVGGINRGIVRDAALYPHTLDDQADAIAAKANDLLRQSIADKLKTLVTMIMDLCAGSHKLVECSVSNAGQINMDWSALEDLCGNVLQRVKNTINKMRVMYLSEPDILNRFDAVDHHGSVRWLEENLMEVLFKNRDKSGLPVAQTECLNQAFKALCGNATNNYEVVSELLYYRCGDVLTMRQSNNNLKEFPFNVLPIKVESEMRSQAQKDALAEAYNGTLAGAAINVFDQVVDAPAIAQFVALDWSQLNGSLMRAFNQIVYNYLRDFTDETTLKTYAPLFESFMYSVATSEVNDNKGFPDVVNFAAGGGAGGNNIVVNNVGAPSVESVLTASNASIMSALYNAVDVKLRKKRFVYENIAEVPPHVKDRMKNNLPIYSKLLTMLCNRANLLRQLLLQREFKVLNAPAANGDVPNHRKGANLSRVNNASEHTNGFINRIVALATGLKKCCDLVYKETVDTYNHFMELYPGFINDYKSATGVMPFMPLSNALVVLNPNVRANLLLPNRLNNSPVYKFNFASKMLLIRSDLDVNVDHVPGIADLHRQYTALVTRDTSINLDEMKNLSKQVIQLVRYLADGNCYFSNETFSLRDNVHPVHFAYQTNYNQVINASYLNSVLDLTENPNYVNSQEKISGYVRSVVNPNAAVVGAIPAGVGAAANVYSTRDNLLASNIIDLNIVPINVHAFMREVPFVNILNYAYTFDRMVHDFVMPDYINGFKNNGILGIGNLMIGCDESTRTARRLMIKLLVHPHCVQDDLEYANVLASLFNGSDDTKLGRPRYLSDQLWQKVLLNNAADLGQASVNNLDGPRDYQTVKRNNAITNPPGSLHPTNLRVFNRDTKQWVDVNGNNINVDHLAAVGKARFDTKLVRNLTWFVQLQRLMRVVVTAHLQYVDRVVVNGFAINDPVTTEYSNNDQDGPEYTDGSRYEII